MHWKTKCMSNAYLYEGSGAHQHRLNALHRVAQRLPKHRQGGVSAALEALEESCDVLLEGQHQVLRAP